MSFPAPDFIVTAQGMNPSRAFDGARAGGFIPFPKFVMCALPSGKDPYAYARQLIDEGCAAGIAGALDLIDGKYIFFGRAE